jgi:adenine-specific DNA-methyltransferase
LPRGWYVVTKRFSAKEERRRVVAFVVDPGNFDADYLGFENHLNVIHGGKKGIARELSNGLALFLNSTIFDQHFRSFSGHTQVNATDLRTMKYPDAAILRTFGRWAQEQKYLEQEAIDAYLNRFLDSAA